MARYAALLHLAEGHSPATPISHDTASRAVELAHYWWATADIILSMGDETTEQARLILSWIRRNDLAEFRFRDVQRGVQHASMGLEQAVDYVPALELLVELGWITPSVSDWADEIGTRKKSANYFTAWSEPPLTARVSCMSGVSLRESANSLPPPTSPPSRGGVMTPDMHDTPDTATDTPAVDNPDTPTTPDYSHVDF
jgi:hypothetical protein